MLKLYTGFALVLGTWAVFNGEEISGPSTRVTPQYASAVKEFPFLVHIRRNGSHHCQGVIYNNPANPDLTWIITTASCAQATPAEYNEYQISASEYDLTKPEVGSNLEQRRGVLNIVRHTDFNETTMAFDVAVMRVSKFIKVPEFIEGANLGTRLPTTAAAAIVGWGARRSGQIPPNPVPAKASLPLLQAGKCGELGDLDTELFICAGGAPGALGACAGDTGAPLTVGPNGNRTLIGIASWGMTCGIGNTPVPTVFTNVQAGSRLGKWIEDEVRRPGNNI